MRKILLSIAALAISPAFAQFQVADARSLSSYRAIIPPTDDEELSAIFQNARMILYTEREMPRAYQDSLSGMRQSCFFISAYFNRGPDPRGRGNGNNEFPWSDPATKSDARDGVRNLVGILLPPGEAIRVRSGVNIPSISRSVTFGPGKPSRLGFRSSPRSGFAWRFPPGSEVVEVVTNRVGGANMAFKVLRMTRQREGWFRRVYRPCRSLEEYSEAVGRPVQVAELGVQVLQDRHNPPSFRESARVVKIPQESPVLVARILARTPFKLCEDESFIPTTDHLEQIVPRGYLGAWIGNATKQERCQNCHRNIGQDVAAFDGGDWYGTIRGSDEVFSFLPFDWRQGVSHNGFFVRPVLSPAMEKAGIVAWE